MLEKISDIKPYNYEELIAYCKQFDSVTICAPGRRTYYVHLRDGKGRAVRDLDGQQLRILLESFGVKVYCRVLKKAEKWNALFNTDVYVNDLPDNTLPIVFPSFLAGGMNNDAVPWLRSFFDNGRPFLWWYNDVFNTPWSTQWTRIDPKMAYVPTIGMIDSATYHINYNVDMLKFSDVEPSIPKFGWVTAQKRTDLTIRMRFLSPEHTECHGINPGFNFRGFVFSGQVKADKIVDLFSQYFATLFSTSSPDILNHITPRFYETMCSNAVVFFDTVNDLEMKSWEFRKVTSREDAIKKLQYIADHPDFRKKLIYEQHDYIKRLDSYINHNCSNS